MNKHTRFLLWAARLVLGSALFALGFDLFLEPNGLNAGGLTGLAMVLVHLLGFGTVGLITAIANLPLFAIGGVKIGRRFLLGSMIGMVSLAGFIDLFTAIPVPETEPLIGAIYGGVLCGTGLGIVFVTGASTGGSDIVVRLLKLRWQDVPIGMINMCFDAVVAVLTGLVFQDISRALYSGITIYITGKIIDAVVYRFDDSRVALIISKHHAQVAQVIGKELGRGATYLHGQGVYTGEETRVVLTAVKKQQLAELKRLVVQADPDAFIIVQEAHQVLGDGFSRYTKDSL
ncbi:MAG: YitT family protein [Oscillospiraceae bacterium]|nr:YitT family protein [Oscillospiraceae bacterium]